MEGAFLFHSLHLRNIYCVQGTFCIESSQHPMRAVLLSFHCR